MKNVILMGIVILVTGCSTTKTDLDQKVVYVGDWVHDRSPYIQAGVQAATSLIVTATVKNTEERAEVLTKLQAVSENLSALLDKEQIDPQAVRAALKTKEPYIDNILSSVATIYSAEYDNLKANGYSNLAIELLKAVAKGVKAGSQQ